MRQDFIFLIVIWMEDSSDVTVSERFIDVNVHEHVLDLVFSAFQFAGRNHDVVLSTLEEDSAGIFSFSFDWG